MTIGSLVVLAIRNSIAGFQVCVFEFASERPSLGWRYCIVM
jgi:hypothetical protein